jgi:hypothetical protein
MSFRVKPSYPVIRKASPLTSGLVAAWAFYEGGGDRLNDVTGGGANGTALPQDGVRPDWVASRSGWGVRFKGPSTFGHFNMGVIHPQLQVQSHTIGFRLRPESTENRIISGCFELSTWRGFQWGVHSSKFAFVFGNGSTGFGWFEGPTVAANTDYTFYGTWDQPTGSLRMYVDGSLRNTFTTSTSQIAYASNSPIFGVGHNGTSQNIGFEGVIEAASLYNRVLSAGEISELSHDPFAIFRPRQRSYFYAATVEQGGNTLTAETGTFTLTGIAATLQASRNLTADTGTFALTGIDADLVSVKTLIADSGEFALTGIAADLIASRKIDCVAGEFSLTGIDADLAASRLLSADEGSFSLTGIDADLLANRTIAIAVGEFTLTGIDAGLVASRVLTIDVGTFDLTGIAAGLVYTSSDVPSIDTLLVTRTAEAIIRFTGTTDGNRVQYYIQAAPGTTPGESDAPTGEVTVTRNTPFDFEVEGVDVGDIRVHARAAHRGNVGSWAAL